MNRIDLRNRNRQPELMDDPALASDLHHQALTGLRRVNWWSRTDTVIWNALSELTPASAGAPLTILDLASGGGDLMIRLARRFQQHRRDVLIEGRDISPCAVEYASRQARVAGFRNVKFQTGNALQPSDEEFTHDVVMCSLFLHHLDGADAMLLLQRMKRLARRMVLIDDLKRSALGYRLAWIGCRLLTRSRIVHVDGPLSVAGAFTCDEALNLAHVAGLRNCRIRSHWPERFLLTAEPDHG